MNNKIIFKPHFVQDGVGPHIHEFMFAADKNGDVFKSDIIFSDGVITISETGEKEFSIYVRWNVEGFGMIYINADNGGEFYSKSSDRIEYNLNYEFAKSVVIRNIKRLQLYSDWEPTREIKTLHELSQNFLSDAERTDDEIIKAEYSQKSLKNSLWVSDLLELEYSRFRIKENGTRKDFLFGCDTRGFYQMDRNNFSKFFTELFNYATVTHYLIGDIHNFEEVEGKKRFKERLEVIDEFRKHDILINGRPLFWTHTWVTPEWIKAKSYSDLLKYVEKHVREVVKFYGDKIQIWEVVNEMHDWANEVRLNHEQSIELTKLACDVARDTNPNIKLLINNCRPFGDYVQLGKWHEREAEFPQRTPYQFIKQAVEAGVDFDIIGYQVYFNYHSTSDVIYNLERFREFGKPIQLAEVGAPSAGIKQEFIEPHIEDYSQYPYAWHRHWDEELQADWLEYIFTYAYSRDYVEAANWYDLVDTSSFLKRGGLFRTPNGEKKASVYRLKKLQKKWNNL